MAIIIYDKIAKDYFDTLIKVLLNENYFSFEEGALAYVADIRSFIEKKIDIAVKRPASNFYKKYDNDLQYITYKRNKQTTWYIFFRQKDNRYLIKLITNNHNPTISVKNL